VNTRRMSHVLFLVACACCWPEASPAAHSSGPARRVLAPSASLFANQVLNVLVGLGSADASSEVTANLVFKLQRCDCSWTSQRLQTRASRLGSKALVLAVGVGKKLLLVEVHLPLDFVLSVGGPGRGGRVRTVWARSWRVCMT